jgi:uncharacterized Ntn-hydrolase superfamily protein
VTYSIVARDTATGDLGVAVQSKFPAVGAVVPWVRAAVGGVATQAFANTRFGPDGLALLEGGASAQETLDRLLSDDPLRDQRQVGIVDTDGRAASYTGRDCFAWAGGRTGPGFAAQGNILAGPGVVDGLADTFLAGRRPFPELLVECLVAADAQGGDRRGRESAALYVARRGGGYGGNNDRWIDLRVDEHVDPIGELGRILNFHRLYMDRPSVDDLDRLDESTAAEVRSLLERIGAGPGSAFSAVYQPMNAGDAGVANAEREPRETTGTPAPLPANWDAGWQQALEDWMAVENLEERNAAAGWIDRRVLEFLRSRAAGG